MPMPRISGVTRPFGSLADREILAGPMSDQIHGGFSRPEAVGAVALIKLTHYR